MTAYPVRRLRRLRHSPALRRLAAETRLHPAQLVLPVFVKEDIDAPQPIASMPGVSQHPLHGLPAVVEEAAAAGIGGIMLFGVPTHRDAVGSGAIDPDGILNRAIRVAAEAAAGRLTVQADLCLDEFTDHGHCGVLAADGSVDNDATLEVYARMALAQADAGAAILGLSGMMDGQVAACRAALDAAGRTDVVLLAYSAKYASAFYGPFRDAVESTLQGDRRTYQLDPGNGREGVQEALADVDEGADIVMVKPAGAYLDVLAEVTAVSPVPVWAYQVSGEYAMIEHAAAAGVIDRDRAIGESLLGIRRAGAEAILTYWAVEVAGWLRDGRSLA
ncbi:porphobilinogen synthase [Microbacterium aurum]